MNILLSNIFLNNFGGSELVTLELAEHFQDQGHKVLIYCPNFGKGPLDLSHVTVTSEWPDPENFDIVWIHHNLLVYDERFKISPGQRIIFNHMSSYVLEEFPRNAAYENAVASMILANSPETAQKMQQLGLKNVDLFQNPAPNIKGLHVKYRETGLFISNHRPDLVKPEDLKIQLIGKEFPLRITPEFLDQNAAFVVCNGKTVQYALRARVPIFLYDQFGGPGWLTEENFHKAAWYNFSGRGGFDCDLSSINDWKNAKPISAKLVNWRFKLDQWLYYKELV